MAAAKTSSGAWWSRWTFDLAVQSFLPARLVHSIGIEPRSGLWARWTGPLLRLLTLTPRPLRALRRRARRTGPLLRLHPSAPACLAPQGKTDWTATTAPARLGRRGSRLNYLPDGPHVVFPKGSHVKRRLPQPRVAEYMRQIIHEGQGNLLR